MIDWTKVIISICSIIITGVLIPLLRVKYLEIRAKYLEIRENLSEKQRDTVDYWLSVAVRWAKQYLYDYPGAKKKEEVLSFVSKKLISLGIEVPEEDLDKCMEAIYEEIKKEASDSDKQMSFIN